MEHDDTKESSRTQTELRSICRGYLSSRPVRGVSFPQNVQNLVVRDYAARNRLLYLLSATEYAMPFCFMMLNALLQELPNLGGVIFFSIFMLPGSRERRNEIYERILGARCQLHAALENIVLRGPEDVTVVEDLLAVAFVLPNLPLGGRYEKDETSNETRSRDPFWSALTAAL